MRSKEQIKADISTTRAEMDDLIDDGKDFWAATRRKKSKFQRIKKSYRNFTQSVRKADDAIVSRPYLAIGITVGLGILAGWLFTRPRMKK